MAKDSKADFEAWEAELRNFNDRLWPSNTLPPDIHLLREQMVRDYYKEARDD